MYIYCRRNQCKCKLSGTCTHTVHVVIDMLRSSVLIYMGVCYSRNYYEHNIRVRFPVTAHYSN